MLNCLPLLVIFSKLLHSAYSLSFFCSLLFVTKCLCTSFPPAIFWVSLITALGTKMLLWSHLKGFLCMVKNGCRSEKLTTLAATGRGSVPIQISVTVGGFKEAEGERKRTPPLLPILHADNKRGEIFKPYSSKPLAWKEATGWWC